MVKGALVCAVLLDVSEALLNALRGFGARNGRHKSRCLAQCFGAEEVGGGYQPVLAFYRHGFALH